MELHFNRNLSHKYTGVKAMKNAGFLAVQELGEILGYAEKAGEELVEVRTGNNFQNELSRLIFACDVSLLAQNSIEIGRNCILKWAILRPMSTDEVNPKSHRHDRVDFSERTLRTTPTR